MSNNLIILLLICMLLIYCYKDNLFNIKNILKFNKTNNTNNTNNIEGFSGDNELKTQDNVKFNNTWYLRGVNNANNANNAIILNNKISLPVIRYGYYDVGSYDKMIGNYFRHNIYPIEFEKLITGLDTIYRFINGDIDVAFINEELLTRFIKKDCKYLTKYILNNLGINIANYDLSIKNNIDRLYPPVNFSAIGVGYNEDFYLIVNNYSNIIDFLDIKNKSIGIYSDSYYYFIKLCSSYGINTEEFYTNTNTPNKFINGFMDMNVEESLETLIKNFKINKYDGIFVVLHPKNLQLLDLSLNMKVRYINIQKRDGIESRNNLINLIPEQQGTNSQDSPPSPPSINMQAIYAQKVIDDLKTENIKESYNKLIKKYFQCITPRTVDLNKFYKSGNTYSYLETFSTRMILIIRDDIPRDKVKYITQNYINNLEKMRDFIDREEFKIQINNFSSLEFNYNELVSFDAVIPLAIGSKDIYLKEGLIYYMNDERCKI